ncbi:MAG TPA: SNF2-related protein [Polyangiaceae bacterium]|nr:SNF2-related protein [Polyangiaceae bacterium]
MLSGASPTTPTAPGVAPLPLGRLNEVLRNERAPTDLREARAALLELARRKSGHLPAEWLVAQALRVSEGTDWAAQRAALEALLRRIGFASRDALSVEKRPARGALWGRYVLAGQRRSESGRGRKSERRPYDVDVYGLEPLAASCNCADFLRSSLGLCKHLLVVLEDIAQQRRSARSFDPAGLPPAARPELCWEPVRAWTGRGDRLEGLRWGAGASAAPAPRGGRGASARAQRAAAQALGGGAALRRALEDEAARGALVQLLLERYEAQPASAEPAALALLREERDLLARLSAGALAAGEALPHLKSLRRRLYPYQIEGVQRFLERQRLLLADDMGLGKTTQAIAACHALYCAGRVERGLLIVPAPLRDQWQREWQATTDRAPLAVVEGRAEERARRFEQTKRGFLVMSYEQLLRDLGAVRRFAPSLIVLDEAQRIKNWTTKSSAYVTSLQPEWRLVLTGTPLENRLEELATLLDWVDDSALAPKWRLAPWHTSWAPGAASERTGARHLDTLRERLAPCLLRRVRREVLRQLPPRSDVRVPVEVSAPQREEHDARVPAIARLVQSARRRPLRQPEFLALMQLLAQQRIVSNGLALLRFDEVWPVYSAARADEALLVSSASPKLAEFRRVLSQLVLEQKRKVVVFSQWRKMLRLAEWAVRDLLEDAGLSSVFFTGEESQRARSANVAAFHEQPGVCVMFLSDAGGVGLNLQHAANACINLELPWNPAVLEQRIGRIYRLGQKDPIDVINLVSEYGIEARIAGLVGNKHALFSGLFDGTTDTVRFEGPASFIGDIERLLEPIEVPELEARDDSLESAPDADLEPALEAEPAPPVATEQARELPPAARESEQPSASGAPASAAPGAPDIARLFASVAVSTTAEGGLRIEAPPDAAAALSQLLSGFAQLLQAAAPPRR